MDILFFGKKEHWATGKCLEYLACSNTQTNSYLGARGDRFPDDLEWFNYDLVISFSSPWIIGEPLLRKANNAAINFHPGPPEYPGIGYTNFAIYDEQTTFGVTCHYMEPKVDSGKIIAVDRFPLFATDTVQVLTDRCYHHMFAQFVRIVGGALSGSPLPISKEEWQRKPYTRRELNELCIVTPNMSELELNRRVRATTFPGMPGAYLELHGRKFTA
jgi:methionyl-tRNA formyltransferase